MARQDATRVWREPRDANYSKFIISSIPESTRNRTLAEELKEALGATCRLSFPIQSAIIYHNSFR